MTGVISKSGLSNVKITFLMVDCLLMVFNATFNNISAISWRSVLLVEETGLNPEKTADLSQVSHKLYYILLHQVDLAMNGFELTTLVLIGIDFKR